MMNKFYKISLSFLFLLCAAGVKAESKLIKVTRICRTVWSTVQF